MTDKKNTYSLGIVLLAMVLGMVLGVMFAPKLDRSYWHQQTDNMMNQRVNQLMHIVDNYYVDDINYDSVSESMMNSMLASLDPHSRYLSPDELKKEVELVRGNFEGVGVVLFYVGDTVYAGEVMSGSPAERAGVLPGDRIMRVDTTLVSGAGLCKKPEGVVGIIRGPRFSTVTLGVQRGGSQQIVPIKIQRNVISHSSIPTVTMLDKTTGYIFISHFADNTGNEFSKAVATLKKQGMQHLVIDLRSNGGGVLQSAIEVADELLPKGDLIVYTQGAHEKRQNVYATRGGGFESGKLTILINEFSASASEVVSGAIQDNDRGTIVGRRSFGKGLVQREFDLPGDAAMLLTIARYYSPSGRCIQRPYDKGSDEYYTQYLMRLLNSDDADTLFDADTSQCFLTKKGRKVYGGGGIQPDKVIPFIHDKDLVYYNRVLDANVPHEAAMDYLHLHYGEIIKKYPTAESFEKNFQISDAEWNRLLALADKKGLKRDETCIKKYGNEIKARYKAFLAQSLYGTSSYYRIMLPFDDELQKALK